MDKLIHIADSMVSTKVTGKDKDLIVAISTRNTANTAIKFTFTISAVMLSIKS